MTRIASLFLSVTVLASGFTTPAEAQTRGKELYDLMGSRRLVTTTGSFQVTWLPQGQGILESRTDDDERTEFYAVDPVTEAETPFLDAGERLALREQYIAITGNGGMGLPFQRFDLLGDGAALTFETEGRYFHFDRATRTLRELLRPEIEHQPYSDELMRRMSTSQLWNGTYDDSYRWFAYVKGYDLYVTETATGRETRLTHDGSLDTFNGRPNWVYPEEFSQRDAYWFSPDGTKLAYYRSDEHDVHKYPIVHALEPEAALELQSYPKAGEPNPTVVLRIVDIASGATVEAETNSTPDNYIVRPFWLPNGEAMLLRRMNRRQNVMELLRVDAATGAVDVILTEEEEAFVNIHDNLSAEFRLLGDDVRFLWASERSGWRHLYLYDLDGNELAQLTDGDRPVNVIVGLDAGEEWVYFTAHTNMGLETHLFRVRLDGTDLEQLTTEPGSHMINMDPTGTYYVDTYSSFDTPMTANLHRADGTLIRNIMHSETEGIDTLALEPPELVTVLAADGTTELHGLLYKPAGYDPQIAYPLIVPVYGGPHTKSITNRYVHSGGDQRLAQLGFMVFRVDNRGLQQRGKAFETATYLQLGQVDLADQVAAVRQIAERPYIDGSRVGLFGGSYGGYMTIMGLLKEPEVFHVGVAHAPVTDWRNYDTIYTERYMRTPQENPEGYDLGSTLPYADHLEGKLLITHGSVDNNVHPGNTTQLIDALITADKSFDLMFYPGHRHGLRGAAGRHAAQRRAEYFVEHLAPPTYPW
jgi:dipeptidyl-peptidase-4